MIPELRLLGGAALIAADGQLVSGAAAQPRRLAVLAVLADAWPASVTRERMVGLIWPENDDAGARRLLSQALYSLRRELGDVISVSGRDIAIDADVLRVDLIGFRHALREGHAEVAAGLYRGAFLDGLNLRDAVEFERWSDTVRDETRRQFQSSVESIVDTRSEAGQLRDAARWAERLVETAPYDVSAVLQVMSLWERAGDRGAATAAAIAYDRRMRDDLELEPDPAVQLRSAGLRVLDAERPLPTAPADEITGDDASPTAARARVSAPAPAALPSRESPRRIEVGTRHTVSGVRAAWLAAIGALAALLVVVSLLTRDRGGANAAPASRAVVLSPFVVRGDAFAGDSINLALSTILLANLDGVNGVQLARAAEPSSGGAVTRIASPLATLGGTVVISGDRVRLDAELPSLGKGGSPVLATVSGARDSLLALAEQLSLQLLPGFYPQLDTVISRSALRRVRRVAPLRLALDGEMLLRRGDFDASFAAFRTLTEMDSTSGYGWFRRAIAADLSHRNADVDASIAAARRHAAALSERELRLLRGIAEWRGGDAATAGATFRALVESESRDREAWFQFAELAYHAGPLLGRPLDESLDAWRHLIALDSGSYPALMHAIRLEARRRDTSAVAQLLHRAGEVQGTGPAALESRVVAAYAVGRPATVQGILDSLPHYSVDFLQAVVAGMLERPADAREIARRLTGVGHPDAVRAEGHIAMANLSMAQGRWRDAWTELDQAARFNAVGAAWTRAYLTTLPFVSLPDSIVANARQQLAATLRAPTTAPLYLQLAVEPPAASVIQQYLATQLAHAGGAAPPNDTSDQCSASAVPPSTRALCLDLRIGLAAERARRTGRPAEALAHLESMGMRVPYQFAARSLLFARSRERFLRAELLFQLGRDADAHRWFESVPSGSRMDYLYLSPSHLRRGQIRERAGDRAAAAEHYRRVLELSASPDPELAGVRDDAAAGLRRVTTGR